MNPSAVVLFAAVVLTAASGSQCHRTNPAGYASYGPRVLTQNPTLGDVVQVVNDNSAKIRSLYTTDATLTVSGAPSLRANLAMERQKKLRLRAETGLTGPELDLGSNDELFWFWVKRNPPPTIYYCRHAQFEASAAKQFVPVEPQWLLDAIGLAWFDPALQHTPPVRNAQNRLEIRTSLPGPAGTKTKTTVVDEARGWVLEQHLYDERGVLIASAMTNRHTLDPASGAALPQEIEIISPANQFRLKFEIRQWTVNALAGDPTQLFTMPNVPGWSVVDLADPRLQNAAPSAQVPSPINAPANVAQRSPWGVAGPSVGPMGPMFAPPTITPATQPTTVPGLTPLAPVAGSGGRY